MSSVEHSISESHPIYQEVSRALSQFNSALFSKDGTGFSVDWASALKRVSAQAGLDNGPEMLEILLELGFPCKTIMSALEQELSEALAHWFQDSDSDTPRPITVQLTSAIVPAPTLSSASKIPGVKHVIAVASGKGGVGKSTTAVNLAVALQQEGAAVGLLDADIYGPSVQMMLGLQPDQRPELLGQQRWKPIQAHGVEAMSMAFLVTERTPMLWRGPMVSGALLQLLQNTQWPELDYLIVDMPPGTGDIQLTCVQKVPISGAVIVTTPQDIALLDAKKGIEMFRKVGVPILGIAENMALHTCSKCGHEEHLFGEGGGKRIAELYSTHLLGSLPLDITVRTQADCGTPVVAAEPDSPLAQRYRGIARAAAASLWGQLDGFQLPIIEVLDD